MKSDVDSYHDLQLQYYEKDNNDVRTEMSFLSIVPGAASAQKNGSQKRTSNATSIVNVSIDAREYGLCQ